MLRLKPARRFLGFGAVLVFDGQDGAQAFGGFFGFRVVHAPERGVRPVQQHRQVAVARIHFVHVVDRLGDQHRLAALAIAVVVIQHVVDVLELVLDAENGEAEPSEVFVGRRERRQVGRVRHRGHVADHAQRIDRVQMRQELSRVRGIGRRVAVAAVGRGLRAVDHFVAVGRRQVRDREIRLRRSLECKRTPRLIAG